MALLKIKAKAKILITWGSANLSFMRGIDAVKDTSITYSGAVGQAYTAGQVLYSSGTSGMPGYIQIKSRDNATLNGSGIFYLTVENYPTATDGNRTLNFNIDESAASLNLYYNSAPNVTDIIVETNNRTAYTFKVADFTSHYSDFDSDAIAQVQIGGDTTGYTLNGAAYASGSWINIADIQNGLLKYQPLDQSDYYEKDNTWTAKDAQGNISVN